MTVTLGFVLFMLFGTAIIIGALNGKKLISWENHALTSMADAVQNYRETLEEEQRLLDSPAMEPAPTHSAPQPRGHHGNRAA